MNFQKKYLIIVITVVLLLAMLTSGVSSRENEVEKEYVIGICAGNLSGLFLARVVDAMNKVANLFGNINTIAVSAEWDVALQVRQMEEFIARPVDAIILISTSAEGTVPAIKKANAAGIPVIVSVDTVVGGDFYYSGSVYSSGAGGEIAAEYIAEKLKGKGNIIVIQGIAGVTTTFNRMASFEAEIKKYPDLKIVYNQYGDWGTPTAMKIMADALTRFPNKEDIHAVYTHCDEMAIGAVRELKTAGRLDDVIVVGIDGNPIGLDSIAEGEMTATMLQSAEAIGAYAMVQTIKVLYGQNPKKYNLVPWDIVTKENVEKYRGVVDKISSAFSVLEDFYPTQVDEPPAPEWMKE